MKRILLSWSSGKDSAWALHVLRRRTGVDVAGLFCTTNREYGRGAMHGVRKDLIERQAERAGLPLELVPIPHPCSNAEYDALMGDFVGRAKARGVEGIAFGDLFLEDVRAYRESRLAGTGLEAVFPLWGMPTHALAREMIAGGLRARITCVDPGQLAAEFSGCEYDGAFLERLPDGVDRCGENGEFHSFAFDGPMFDGPIGVDVGETVSRDGFVFTDLLPQADHRRCAAGDGAARLRGSK